MEMRAAVLCEHTSRFQHTLGDLVATKAETEKNSKSENNHQIIVEFIFEIYSIIAESLSAPGISSMLTLICNGPLLECNKAINDTVLGGGDEARL